METAPLKSFATWARRELITQVSARLTAVLAPSSPERVENQRAVAMLERDIAAAGGDAKGKDAVADKVAYTWFNRIIALRFMDANGHTGIGVVSPAHGQEIGQPEILADAKRGSIDPAVITNKRTLETITGLLDGTRASTDAQGEAYTLLLAEYCRYWNRSMPFMFEREGDYTELLIPANLLAAGSILTRAAAALTEEVCREVEVIGWLYQFYISERKDEVFAGFKKGKKAGAAEIPAATQLFTPHWIVRYLVENSVGRLWMLNHPSSRLVDQMDYYIAPVDDESDFLKIASPEELTVIDPACGSGHMLTYAFDLLYAIYEEEGYAPSEIPELILTHNLYGTEIDPRAGALAAFALTMKAREKQRTFFSKQVRPKVCVVEPISFTTGEIDFLVTPRGDHEAEVAFWNEFRNGDVVGSLARPDHTLTTMLKQHLTRLAHDGDILLAGLLARAEQAVSQAEFLLPRYSVVVANPPYMGAKSMDSRLAEFARSEYKDSRSDLFAMFIERCLGLLAQRGMAGMVTMQSWMFGSSLEQLRAAMMAAAAIRSMAHLGPGAFDTISGEVVSTTAFVLEDTPSPRNCVGTFIDLTRSSAEAGKSAALRSAGQGRVPVCSVPMSSFVDIPGGPISYWAVPQALSAFRAHPPVSSKADLKAGISTGDNTVFERHWFEVSWSRISPVGSRDLVGTKRWTPCSSGGRFRRWYGNNQALMDWENGGERVRAHAGSAVRNPLFQGQAGLTYSKIGGARFSARYAPAGYVFDDTGRMIFPHAQAESGELAALLNSSTSQYFLDLMSPGLTFTSTEIGKIPWAPLPGKRLGELASRATEIARSDWDSIELSWDFRQFALVDSTDESIPLAEVLRLNFSRSEAAAEELRSVEGEINRCIAEAYRLEGVVESEVAISDVALISNPAFVYGNGADDVLHQAVSESVRSLISYAVGCMFGRYSLDETGLILADQGATVQDYLAKVPRPTFVPDSDNVLPIVDGDWFEDDIVARFRQFLRAAFGEERFEENLRFVEESLGVKTLREYFVTRAGRSKFYDDHVKRYKKRPIYWLFSSPKGSFNALIYMHRYTPSTVSTVLNEYLREFESKLEANLQHQERLAAGDGTPREKAAALKEAERLRKVLLELREYEHDVLYPLASQQITIDLDDGVKVNYPRFYPALKKITGLEAADE